MLLSLPVLTFVCPLIVVLLTLPMRLLIDPLPLVSEIRNLIRISALVASTPHEVASVGKHIKPPRQIRLMLICRLPLIVTREISIIFRLVEFSIAFG